ncbi:hypothetical protein NPIL_214851 [Nephila pilipes]|uniref:Uncharacterized protein n=1 Tax=Nephila pilipes TaxID=299642 RepID=A0A8X6N8V1_NEPPI|nr:hypothetical protein NPIL_214851 [Nephila pilipes]
MDKVDTNRTDMNCVMNRNAFRKRLRGTASVMIRGEVSSPRTATLAFILRNMDSTTHQKMLRIHLKSHFERFSEKGTIFQLDNALQSKCRVCPKSCPRRGNTLD